MPSSLRWTDHDATARERSLRILALFQEQESRDELGLGGVPDSFADRFFSRDEHTIQTRLRYMLFVPWMYRALEEKRTSPGEFARRADTAERDLIDTMRNIAEKVGQLDRLKRHLALYRLVLGQPRQEDLLTCLATRLDMDDAEATTTAWRISLKPPDVDEG